MRMLGLRKCSFEVVDFVFGCFVLGVKCRCWWCRLEILIMFGLVILSCLMFVSVR